ncbi:hypothetical protein KCU83_g568, partial [Aureobasidium melanogenum]
MDDSIEETIITTLPHSLDDGSSNPSILAHILNDLPSTRDILRLVRALVTAGNLSTLDDVVHDDDSSLSASIDGSIDVVPIVHLVCIDIDHVKFGQLSSIDIGKDSRECLHTRSYVYSNPISKSSVGYVFSSNFGMPPRVPTSRKFFASMALACRARNLAKARDEAVVCG